MSVLAISEPGHFADRTLPAWSGGANLLSGPLVIVSARQFDASRVLRFDPGLPALFVPHDQDKSMRNHQRYKRSLFYGYIVVIASFAIIAVSAGANYSFSVFFEPLQEHFGWSRATTAGAFSAFMVGYGVFSIGSGRLSDRFGPRLIVSISGLLFGLGFLTMSRVDTIGQFYISYGVILAAAWSAIPVSIMATVARWFHTRRGLMTGVAMAGTGVGTMVMPPLANWLIHQSNWRTSYMVFGIILTVVIVLAAQFLRRDPSEKGLQPLGVKEETHVRSAQTSTRTDLFLSDALRIKQFWLLTIALAGFGYTLQSVMVHVVIHARGLGLSPASAASVIAVIGGFGVAGRIGVGGLADRLGLKRMITIAFAVLSLSLFWLVIANQAWAVYTFAIVFGLVYGGVIPLLSSRVAELFGLRALGAIVGFMLFGVAIGNAIGPVATGYGFDLLGSYSIPFTVCGLLVGLGALLTFFVKPMEPQYTPETD